MNNFLMKLFRCWWRGHVSTPLIPIKEFRVNYGDADNLKMYKLDYEIKCCYFCNKVLYKKQICRRPKIKVEMLEE